MDIEEVRELALNLHSKVTEELFAEQWISFRICGKWFLLVQLDAEERRIAVKLPPEQGEALREKCEGVTPAYHMNKRHWNDLYLDKLNDKLVKDCIKDSFELVVSRLTKKEKVANGLI